MGDLSTAGVLRKDLSNQPYLPVVIDTNVAQMSGPLVVGQAIIAATGTAVQLPSNNLGNGLVITAKSTNAAKIFIGGSSVTTADTGAGNGYPIVPGGSASAAVSNANQIWINGTAGDIVYFIGN